MTPGSFVFYALPRAISRSQFYISPANTVLGFALNGITIKGAELSGGLDVTLRSPTPLQTANTISPQFYDVHMQLELTHVRIIVGQYPDILLPFVPDTPTAIPAATCRAPSVTPAAARTDWRLLFGERAQLLLKLSANQPVQTFDLSPDAVGRQGGRPDMQARVALAIGRSRDSKLAWNRPFELGIGGHTGARRVTFMGSDDTRDYPDLVDCGRLAPAVSVRHQRQRTSVVGRAPRRLRGRHFPDRRPHHWPPSKPGASGPSCSRRSVRAGAPRSSTAETTLVTPISAPGRAG